MNERAEVQELSALLRSKVPIILIETHEEPRILKLLQQACNLEQQVMFRWSIVDGITRNGRDEPIYTPTTWSMRSSTSTRPRRTASTCSATRIPASRTTSTCA